jgi:hypothetical protein
MKWDYFDAHFFLQINLVAYFRYVAFYVKACDLLLLREMFVIGRNRDGSLIP